MIELLAAASLLFAVAAVVAAVFALSYRADRDEALLDLTIARGDITSLTNRVTVLRGENIAQQASIDLLREGRNALAIERDDLKRQLGRIEAEKVAIDQMALPKRDKATGRFLKRPAATKAKPKPVACG